MISDHRLERDLEIFGEERRITVELPSYACVLRSRRLDRRVHARPHDRSFARVSKLEDGNRVSWIHPANPAASFDSRVSLSPRSSSLSIPYYDARPELLGWMISSKDFPLAKGWPIVRDADTFVIFPWHDRPGWNADWNSIEEIDAVPRQVRSTILLISPRALLLPIVKSTWTCD